MESKTVVKQGQAGDKNFINLWPDSCINYDKINRFRRDEWFVYDCVNAHVQDSKVLNILCRKQWEIIFI